MAVTTTSRAMAYQPDTKAPTVAVNQIDIDTKSNIHDVVTTVNYYKAPPDGSAPKPNIASRPETFQPDKTPFQITVHDIRGHEEEFKLDTQGWELFRHESAEKDFATDEEIERVYYPETIELIKNLLGASRVEIFGHAVRRASAKGPVFRVHIDQTDISGPNRVRRHVPDEAERLLKTRVQILNVWRPVKTVEKDPLALCDDRSCPDSDLVPVKVVYPDRETELHYAHASDKHKWYYYSRMRPNEVLMFKCYDSKKDGRARRVPHAGFIDHTVDNDNLPARESIETRCIVFYEDQEPE